MRPISKRQLNIVGVTVGMSCVLTSALQPALAQDNLDRKLPAPVVPEASIPSKKNRSFHTALGLTGPRIRLTRDVAAQKFLSLLRVFSASSNGGVNAVNKPDDAMMSSFSLSSDDEKLPILLLKLSEQLGAVDENVTVQSEGETDGGAKTATVIVESKSRPLVLVEEGDNWGVDVFETYAQWNGLQGEAKAVALEQLKTEFLQQRDAARRSSCQSNLKQISLGMLQYSQDHGDQFPKAENWIDQIMPYIKSEKLFACPSVSEPEGYGYAFNLHLSLQSLAAFASPAQTVSIYETSLLERNMFGVGDEPAFRHQDGTNYAFADGHVKWFPKADISKFKWKP